MGNSTLQKDLMNDLTDARGHRLIAGVRMVSSTLQKDLMNNLKSVFDA